MSRTILHRSVGFLAVPVVWSWAIAGHGQTPTPGQVIKPQTSLISPGVRSQPVQRTPDPFDSMVASAASFDMDSPVEARAEFDPPVAVVGGHVIYRIVVTALDESLEVPEELPTPKGLELHPGGRGQTYQPTGGARLRPQTTVLFRATVTNTGAFIMPGFDLTAYGKTVRVPEAGLKVVPAGMIAPREPPRLLMEPPEGDVYVGQALRISIALPDSGEAVLHGLSQPRITGEFIFSEPFPVGMRQANLRGSGKMSTALVQELMVTPLRAGPRELIAQAHSFLTRPMAGPTGALQSYTLLIDSDPLILNVKPLPTEGQPPGFTGAVGHFQVEPPKLSTNEIRAGEPVTLTLILRGDGNVSRLTPPQIPSSRDWQTFPAVAEQVTAYAAAQSGFAAFDYTLIPISEKITATPRIPFSFFDPKKGAYVDLGIPPAPILVKPAQTGLAGPTASAEPSPANPDAGDGSGSEKEPTLTGLDKEPGRVAGSLLPLQQRWWFLLLQLAPAMGLGGLWAWDRRRRYLEDHPEVVRRRIARRGVRRELRVVRRAAGVGDANGFVRGATNALREACAPHANAEPGALVGADVLEELQPLDREGRAGQVARRLFAAADASRFGGPGKDGADLLGLKPDLERILDRLKERL